jgi:hypothetical protein
MKLYETVTCAFFTFHLKNEIPAVFPPSGTEIAVLDERALVEKKATLNNVSNIAGTVDRMRKGDRLWIALKDDEVFSYCWASHRNTWIDEVNRGIQVPENEVYFYDAFTRESHRGKRFFPSILVSMLAHYRGKHVERAVIGVLLENVPSRRAVMRAGFRRVAYVKWIRVLRFSSWKIENDCRSQRPLRFL